MKIHKALKVKNRLAGEVSRLMELAKRENSRRNDNTSTVNRIEIFTNLDKTVKELVKVKSTINKANSAIYDKIVELNELKGYINFIKSLPTRRGEEKVFTGRGDSILTYTWTSELGQEDVDNKVVELQEKANLLQDDIDTFNSATEISI